MRETSLEDDYEFFGAASKMDECWLGCGNTSTEFHNELEPSDDMPDGEKCREN